MTTAVDALAGIPALPVAVAKVLEETGRDEPDARIIARAIETDAGLASKMLSLVNSPYYGLNGTVTSLSQAVMIVGMRQVRNVALAVGALRSLPGVPPAVIDAFLDRAMTTARSPARSPRRRPSRRSTRTPPTSAVCCATSASSWRSEWGTASRTTRRSLGSPACSWSAGSFPRRSSPR